ncbi:hypothetical protein A2U01_0027945, partial [Trifolium medium]|nr:hypothetical protein [Trifolium medium]
GSAKTPLAGQFYPKRIHSVDGALAVFVIFSTTTRILVFGWYAANLLKGTRAGYLAILSVLFNMRKLELLIMDNLCNWMVVIVVPPAVKLPAYLGE